MATKYPHSAFCFFVFLFCVQSPISLSTDTKKVVKHGEFYSDLVPLQQLAAPQTCIRSLAQAIES